MTTHSMESQLLSLESRGSVRLEIVSPVRPAVLRYVAAVVRAERANGDGGHVVERVFARLQGELGRLIGPAGFEVLLARAVVLARRAHPLLAGVGVAPGGALVGLRDDLRDASAAIVLHFVDLFVSLVGDDLAERLLLDLWPAARRME